MGGCSRSKAGFVDTMDDIQRHGLRSDLEDRRLAHIIPEAGSSILIELLVEPSPPSSSSLCREVRKDGRPRPHLANVHRTIGIFHEVISRDAGVVRRIPLVWPFRNVKIG